MACVSHSAWTFENGGGDTKTVFVLLRGFVPLERAEGPHTMDFNMCLRFRNGGETPNLACSCVGAFGPWERAVGPKTPYFVTFWALEKGGGAQHLVFY